MSKEKETFTDPQTGEEMESTGVARLVGRLTTGLGVGVGCGLFFGVLYGLTIWGLQWDLIHWQFALSTVLLLVLFAGLGFGLFGMLLVGLAFGVVSGLSPGLLGNLNDLRSTALFRWGHDSIARQQHFRHQRRLQRKLFEEEWAGVPAGAISRACPPGEPKPTPASLSLAELPAEDVPRLAAGAETATEAEKQVQVEKP
jgi:hypothetical protein